MLQPLTWRGHRRVGEEQAKAFFNERMSEQNTATKSGSADNLTLEASQLNTGILLDAIYVNMYRI